MTMLVLGGTGFLSSAVVAAALASGEQVVTVTRGRSGTPPAGVTAVHADRDDAVALREALTGLEEEVSAVIDSCGYTVQGARAAAEVLGPGGAPVAAGLTSYLYVSSISAYRGWPPGPVQGEEDPTFGPDDDLEAYGPMKAESERVLGGAFGARLLSVRAGLIIGPGDRTRRMTTWLHRIATQPRVVVPADVEQPLAFIDARDLAAWLVGATARGLTGAVNATGPVGMTTFGGLLQACRAVVADAGGQAAELVPVSEGELLAAGVRPWADLPFWLPQDVASTAWQVETTRARAWGLPARPVEESLADTWDWVREVGLDHPDPPRVLSELLTDR